MNLHRFVFASLAIFGTTLTSTVAVPTQRDSYENSFQAKTGEQLNSLCLVRPGAGVNGFLWHAALDTISFLPIASANPINGVILTGWFSMPDMPDERTKLKIFIHGRELIADNIKVSVSHLAKDEKGVWKNAPVAATTSRSLKDAILIRAHEIDTTCRLNPKPSRAPK